MSNSSAIIRHYSRTQLRESILAALSTAGVDLAACRVDDLRTFDEFHIGGREATLELAALAQVSRADLVVDLGCGIGGPARTLGGEFGCRVVGVDLVAEYALAASTLTRMVGLQRDVRFLQADMNDLPFASTRCDLAWSQHTTMNVADKSRLCAEVYRVLRPGGRYALYEICAGSGEPVDYPVPWASTPALSYLVSAAGLRDALVGAGFTIPEWHDVSPASLRRLSAARDAGKPDPAAPPRPSLRLLMGPTAAEQTRNLAHNIETGKIVVIQAIARRTV